MGSIESARRGDEHLITTAFSQGSISDASHRTGICDFRDSIDCSLITPMTPPRAPVMPTSLM
jgi:hypothetical protein